MDWELRKWKKKREGNVERKAKWGNREVKETKNREGEKKVNKMNASSKV